MKLEILIIIFFIRIIFIKEDTIHYRKDVIAPNTPIKPQQIKTFDFKGYIITPLRYFITLLINIQIIVKRNIFIYVS
jgi:hypothetical protein